MKAFFQGQRTAGLPPVLFIVLIMATPALPAAQNGEEAGSDTPGRLAAWEVIRGDAEIGVSHVSGDSARFGRYTGLDSRGFYPLLNLDWFLRAPWDSDRPDYLIFRVDEAGLDSRRGYAEYGRQGAWSIWLKHDRIPAYRSDTTRTPYRESSSGILDLPPTWEPGASTAEMTQLLPSLGRQDLRQDRRTSAAGLAARIAETWEISTSYRQENRRGTRATGATMGSSGGNARSVLLAAPVDYRTREFQVTAGTADPKKQLELRYLVSIFDNRDPALNWANPFAGVGGWHPAAAYPSGRGQLATPPDNRFHQLSAAGGYNWTDRTRLSADVAIGRMSQDDDFLPYTVNPALTVTQALPRSSLDGRIDTTVVNLRALHRPGNRLQLTARYRLDDRDNQTPRDEYAYIGGDSQNQDLDPASNRRRFNQPYSFREHRAGLDARYRLAARSRLGVTVERRQVERTFAEREEVRENRIDTSWTVTPTPSLSTGLRGEIADRSGSTYDGTADLANGYAAEYAESVPGGWVNVPGLRQFHLADRRRFRLAGSVQYQATEEWTVGAELSRSRDDYRRSTIGLADTATLGGLVNIAWVPARETSVHGFYGRERYTGHQIGHSVRGGANRLPDLANPERMWFADQQDRVETVGAGARRTVLGGRVELEADYSFTNARSRMNVTTGDDLLAEPLPNNRVRSHSFILRGGYALTPRLSLSLRYWMERYRSSDWAVDDVPVDQLAGVILLGESSPDYTIHTISTFLSYRY